MKGGSLSDKGLIRRQNKQYANGSRTRVCSANFIRTFATHFHMRDRHVHLTTTTLEDSLIKLYFTFLQNHLAVNRYLTNYVLNSNIEYYKKVIAQANCEHIESILGFQQWG